MYFLPLGKHTINPTNKVYAIMTLNNRLRRASERNDNFLTDFTLVDCKTLLRDKEKSIKRCVFHDWSSYLESFMPLQCQSWKNSRPQRQIPPDLIWFVMKSFLCQLSYTCKQTIQNAIRLICKILRLWKWYFSHYFIENPVHEDKYLLAWFCLGWKLFSVSYHIHPSELFIWAYWSA